MKRILLPLLVVLLIAGAFVYLQRRVPPHARQVAGWLPGDTILFEDIPDIPRTSERWPDTELAQIIQEPEVQAFFQRPAGRLPFRAQLDDFVTRLRRIQPVHTFIAVTQWPSGGIPSAVAGLDIAGSREDLDAMVGDLRRKAQETWPQAHSDIEKYGSGDIETFTAPNFTAALAYRGNWLFIATDATLLKSTLDKVEGQHDPNSLAELPSFQASLAHLPPAADSIFFLRPALLADQISSFALMLNPTADVHPASDIKKFDSVAMAMKLDGPVMRDATYIVDADLGPTEPLARDAIRLSSSDTIILLSKRIGLGDGNLQMPDPKADPSGILALVETWLGTFAQQGLGAKEFDRAFGPDSGFVVDWPGGSVIPTPLAMIDVRDPALARKFLDTLATLPLAAGVEFTRQDAGSITLYTLPSTGIGFFPVQVSLGLTGTAVIGALGIDPIQQAAERWDTSTGKLDSTEAYKKTEDLVGPPSTSFTYVDTQAVFGRIYGLVRGVAAMGFIPHLGDYVDLSKLPAPETITQHLTPMVSSSGVKDGGLLTESAGPVTATQGTFVAAAILGAVAVPMIEDQFKGQSVSFPGFPGFNLGPSQAPSVPTAPPINAIPTPSPSTPAASPAFSLGPGATP